MLSTMLSTLRWSSGIAVHTCAAMRLLNKFVVLAAALAGCTSGPDFVRPDKPKEQGYTPENLAPQTASSAVADGGAAQTFVPAEDIPGQWWTLFRSAELNALIDEALKANPDLDAAQASLRQANEALYAQQGALFPGFNANASGQNALANGVQFGQPGTSFYYGVTTASLNISYAPDIFGGTRRSVQAQAAQAEYQRYQLEATYLTLTSNVVVAAINLASLRGQIAATETIIKIETDALSVVESQFTLGGASRADVLAQQAALTATQATLPPLQKQLAQQRNQLMTLIGKPPTHDAGQGLLLASLKLPEELPLSLPSQLVEQRPDVRSAGAQLHTASANIGVAIANQLPQLTLTGMWGMASAGASTAFMPGTGIWTLGASIAQTLFDGGKLEHTKLAAAAAYDKAAAQYRSTVLLAFQDVANALRRAGRRRQPCPRAAAVPGRLAQLPHAVQRSADLPERAHQPSEGAGAALQRHCCAVPGAGRRLVESHRRRCGIEGRTGRVQSAAGAGHQAAARPAGDLRQ